MTGRREIPISTPWMSWTRAANPQVITPVADSMHEGLQNGGYLMVTVIDMTTGEVIHNSPSQQCKGDASHEQDAYSLPALALQEVALESTRDDHKMPPELAHTSLSTFLAKFD